MPPVVNILKTDHVGREAEVTEALVTAKGIRLERIVSHGQSSPEGFWYDQAEDEWVVVLTGSAALAIEGRSGEMLLGPGDSIYLEAGCRHRVTWTDPAGPTVWLALFIDPALGPAAHDH